uniref:SIFamide n=1 Tax=Callinectes arcuatus TaxID=257891 RepID=A0A7T1L774_CALAT|nr:SIFamide [Callinectes arcuatus]
MSMKMRVVVAVAVVVVVLALLSSPVSAGYRKPPFNGSIFGKRSGADAVYEPGKSQALASVCQVALEACTLWFPGAEKK